jgi:putative peptidoglycan lipid II flippase
VRQQVPHEGQQAAAAEEQDSVAGRQIARAARLVVVLFAISRLLGLAREIVIAAAFATSADYDAYIAAVLVPDIIFNLIAVGALGSAFIPVFAGYLARDDTAGAWRLASSVASLLLVALTLVAGLAWLGARPLVTHILAPGFAPQQQTLTVSLMRTMLFAPVLFGMSGLVMAILNARQHFVLPALAPSLLNIALILAVLLLAPRMGIRALALGYLGGAVLHLTAQLPMLRRVGAQLRPNISLRESGTREVLRLMAPRVLGLAVVQLNFMVNINIGSLLGQGAVSALNYAWRLMLLPHGILAQAVATAAFPTFAEQAAKGEGGPLRSAVATTLRSLFFLTIPAALGLVALGEPLVALLFQREAFQTTSTEAVTWALQLYALGLVGHAGVEIIARVFYALHDTWTPVWVGGLAMGLNVALSVTLPCVFTRLGLPPHGGLALANSIATMLEMGGMLLLIRPKLGGLEGRSLVTSTLRSCAAAAVMLAVLLAWQTATTPAPLIVRGGGGVILGAGAYLIAAHTLRANELSSVLRLLRRRSK